MRTFLIWAAVLFLTAGVAAGIGVAVAYYQPAPAAAEVAQPASGPAPVPVRVSEFAVAGEGMTLQELLAHLRQQAALAGGQVRMEVRVILAEGPDGTVRLLMPGPGYSGRVEALTTIVFTVNEAR